MNSTFYTENTSVEYHDKEQMNLLFLDTAHFWSLKAKDMIQHGHVDKYASKSYAK